MSLLKAIPSVKFDTTDSDLVGRRMVRKYHVRIHVLVIPLIVAFALGYASVAQAQDKLLTEDYERIANRANAYFTAHTANGDFSGQVVISHHGKLIYEGNFGSKDDHGSEPITSETKFPVASLSKTITAGTLLILEKEGTLTVNDQLSKFLPHFPHSEKMPLRLLLLFASGIDNPDYDKLEQGPQLTSQQLVDHIAERELLFLPGTYSQYGNGNYIVLARAIEVATGRPFADVVNEKISQPLQMVHTREISAESSFPKCAAGHTPGPGKFNRVSVKPPRHDCFLGSAGILSTARDMCRWGEAIAERRFFDLDELEYPYGWGRARDHGATGFEQTGAVRGYMSLLRVYPEEGWVIAVLANTEYGQWNKWGSEMARLIFKGSVEIPKVRPPAVSMTSNELNNVAGTYKNGNTILEIRKNEEDLWVYLGEGDQGKYMTRIGDTNGFAVRADWFSLEFDNVSDGEATKVIQTSPEGDKVFDRVKDRRVEKFKSACKSLMKQAGIPGLSFAIVEDGKLLTAGGIGWADIEKRIPANERTLYPTASLSKPIAGLIVMQLVQQGKISLTQPMSEFKLPPLFPGRDHASLYQQNAAEIRHVLSHTSDGKPGTAFRYDGDRFVDVTWVVEQVVGKPYRQILSEEILAKAKMSDSVAGLLSPDSSERLQFLATPYHHGGTGIEKSVIPVFGDSELLAQQTKADLPLQTTDLSAKVKEFRQDWLGKSFAPLYSLNATAGLVTSARDLAKFDIALDQGLWINKAARDKMFTAMQSIDGKPLPYGIGWFVDDLDDLDVVWHYGWMPPAVSALYVKIPKKKLSLIVLCNSEGLSANCDWSRKGVLASPFVDKFFDHFVR